MSSIIATWEWIRAAGISSYLLLFLSILAGILYRAKMVPKKQRAALFVFHQITGWFGFLIGLFHGILLVVDDYVNFSLLDIFVPFSADYRPVLSGLGSIALYSTFTLLLTSDLMKKIGKKVWYKIHIIAFPGFLLAFVHGVFLGTDSRNLIMILFYAMSSTLLLSVFFLSRLTKS